MKRSILHLSLLSVLLVGSAARAEVPPLLQQSTRPMWATLGLGGALGLKDSGSMFKLIETFGYHFSGNSAGPAIAFDLQEAFGEGGGYAITLGPKFVWDFAIIQNLALYLSPSALLGYSYAGGGAGGVSLGALQFAFDGKLILGDRWLVFFRPFSLNVAFTGDGASLTWDLIFGGGATF